MHDKTPLNKVIRGSKRASYDEAVVNEIIDAHFLGYLSYIYENRAICLPMAYSRLDDVIYVHGSLKNRMLLSLLDSGTASMTISHLDGLVSARSVFHHSVNYRTAVVFGSLSRVEDPNEKMKALELITDQVIPGNWNRARQPNQKEFDATLVVALKIESASAKIRDEGVIDEKDDLDLPIWAGVIPVKEVYQPVISNEDLIDAAKSVPENIKKLIGNHI